MASFLPNGRVDRVPGGTLVSTDAPTEDLRGPLTLDRDAGDDTLAAASALTTAQGRLLAVDAVLGIADELRQTFAARGWRQVTDRRLMASHVDGLVDAPHQAVIAGPEHVETMRSLQIEAFRLDPAAADVLVSAASVAASPHAVVFDGETAIAMATAHPTPSGIGVFGVATRRARRREGLATAAVVTAVRAATDLTPARTAWLQANDDVTGAYVPMGFAAISRSEVWLDV